MRTDSTTHRIFLPTVSIIEGSRVRADYGNLEELADSISTNGLIHPIVVDLTHRLIAGGRRFRAMRDILKLTDIPVTFMEVMDEAQLALLEAEENVRRKNMTWQERVCSIRLVHNKQALSAALKSSKWTQSMTGAELGISQANVSYILQIADLLTAKDTEINKCDSVWDAIKLLVKRLEDKAMALVAAQTITKPVMTTQDILAADTSDLFAAPNVTTLKGPVVSLAGRPAPEMPTGTPATPEVIVPLSRMLILADSIAWMRAQPEASFDHIVSDPPYAIEMSNLQQGSGMMDMTSVAIEHDVDQNIELLFQLCTAAYRIVRDKGFVVLWTDMDTWDHLSTCLRDAGFAVQRWPLTWAKTTPCKNEAAQYNFTKNTEIAIIARKGNATLITPQSSCYWQGGDAGEVQSFGHPFAKPIKLWQWVYNAISIRGQRVLDPFAGSGTSVVAALGLGLQPTAIECNEQHHAKLIVNVANQYRQMIPNVRFE